MNCLIVISIIFAFNCSIINGYQIKRFKITATKLLCMSDVVSNALKAIPSSDKSKISILCSGQSIDSALFRAELKKELTFFRGCSGLYNLDPKGTPKVLEIIGEGKTKQLARFLDWVNSLTTELVTRKPSFQGPALVIKIEQIKWEEYEGKFKGFTATEDAPKLYDDANIQESAWMYSKDSSKLEAKSMTGTDESV